MDHSLQQISSHNPTVENKMEIILNSLDQGIVFIDEKDSVSLINAVARELLAVHRTEVLGRPVAKAFSFLLIKRLTANSPSNPH